MANTRRRNRVGWGGSTVVSDATSSALDLLSYDPNPVPEDPEDLGRYISDELFRIRDTFYEILDNMSITADIMLAIAKGDMPGHSSVNKFGRASNIAAAATNWVADGGGSAAYIRASADITHIWSDTDSVLTQGATVNVQGLDANWVHISVDVTLDGANSTTSVALSTAFRRVYRMKLTSSGGADQNIQVGDSGQTFFAAQITAWSNQTLMAAFTVPADTTAYVTHFYNSMNPATNKDPTALNISLVSQDNENGYPYQEKHTHGLDTDATSAIQHDYKPYKTFTEKTDIWIQASPIGKAADVSAGFDLILVEDGY